MSTTGRSPQTHHRPHILIVSDDPELGGFLAEGLVYGGFWTSVVASAIQTLEVFRLRSFDLLLLDAALSGMAAPEVVRRLRRRGRAEEGAQPPTDIPIVVIAGNEAEARAFAEAGAGEDAIVTPPVDLETLVPALHDRVMRWRAEHPGRPWADEAAQLKAD